MKFLCDNCKAKYQIADEKVAGKTVRMKCRKCGHQIEVRAAVTETSVSTTPPQAPGAEPARPAAKSSLATSLSAQKPRAPMASQPQTSALAGAFQRQVQEAPSSVPFPQTGTGTGNITTGNIELSVTDEWYVAINGVPVGPVRISELRRKAASGAVTEDSLCWQEGLEEWRPVRSLPELAALVREAAQGNRPSLISPAPSDGRGSSPPRPPAPQPARPAPARPDPPRHGTTEPMAPPRPFGPAPQPAPARSNVVPLRVAATSNVDDAPPNTAPLGGASIAAAAALAPSFTPMPQPVFAPPLSSSPMPAALPLAPAPLAVSDPFAVPPAPLALASTSGTASVLPPAPYAPSIVPPAPRRGVPLWFWPILVFTGVFGVAAAVFVFRQQQQPVVIQMPAPTAPVVSVAENKTDVPPPVVSGEPAPPTSAPASTGKVAAGGPPKSGTAPAATTEKKGIDLGGLSPTGGGPNVGGGGPNPNAGGGLDSAAVQRVVVAHQAGVKRTCWERGGAAQGSSNVTVSATVGPDGHVVGTSSAGDDPVVGKCIESQVRSWVFAAPGATTTVNIPFKFVRQ